MSNRKFELSTAWITDGGSQRHTTVYSIRCSSCGDEGQFKVNKFSRTAPPDLVHKYFTNKGWLVAKRPSDDLCPKCIAIKADERRAQITAREDAKERIARTIAREAKAAADGAPAVVHARSTLPSNLTESDKDLAVRLLTRMEQVVQEQSFIQGTVTALFDRLADVEKEVAALGPAIKTMTSLSGVDLTQRLRQYEEEETMFVKLAHISNRIEGRLVRVGYTGGNNPQTRITLSGDLSKELGFKRGAGDRVFINVGTGEDDGLVMLERTKDMKGSAYVDIGPTGRATIVTSAVRPKEAQNIPATSTKFGIVEGNLVIRLPEDFTEVDAARQAMAAARQVGAV